MKKNMFIGAGLLLLLSCAQETKEPQQMVLASDAFGHNADIPALFTCDGRNYSPPLSWEKIDSAVTYALICEDPDVSAGPYIHWIVFNLPPTVINLPAQANIAALGGDEGTNTKGGANFTGPCPPGKATHRYYFTVWALDTRLNLSSSVTVTPFKESLRGHIIAQGTLMGYYASK